MVANFKLYIYGAILLAWIGSCFASYSSGFDNGGNAEKLISANLVSDQRAEYVERMRLLANYSNELKTTLNASELDRLKLDKVEIEAEEIIEREVFTYVIKEIESDGAVWLSDCWIRLHDNAATIAAEMPRPGGDPASTCLDDARTAIIAKDRPKGFYSSGEALKVITENYVIARQWRRKLLAFQDRERKISEIKFYNGKQLN